MSSGRRAAGVERDVVVHQGAEHVQHRRQTDRAGSVEIVGLLGRGAGEVDLAERRTRSRRHGDPNHRAVVHLVGERAVLQPIQRPAHLFGGVVLDVPHVGVDRVQPEVRDHPPQFPSALFVGGDLRLQVGQILAWGCAPATVRRRVRSSSSCSRNCPALTSWQVVQQHPFLVDADAVRRHRAGGDAADVGVMAARGDVEQSSRPASSKTGVMTVTSGRWVPPL
jgi:hypothetical protein